MSVKKPPERRQRGKSRTGERPDSTAVVHVLPSLTPRIPVPGPHWGDEVVEGWNDFWSSALAGPQLLRPTDGPALRRLFDMRQRLVDALAAFDEEPITVGSTGQPTISPWAAEVHRLEGVVSRLEDKFGLTPMARMKLGVTFEQGVSLAQHNAQLLEAFHASQSG